MSSDGNGATATEKRTRQPAQLYEALYPSEISFKATGLNRQQYNSLALLWVEVRHIIVTSLGKLELESIDVGAPRRARWVEKQIGEEVDYFDVAKAQGNVDHLNIPLTRWDRCRDTRDKPIKCKYTAGEVGLWARFSSATSNIYYSRLWEMGWGGLKHSVPLRMVHKYYMLQLEVDEKQQIFVKGSKTLKTRIAEKGHLFAQEPYQVYGKSSSNEKFTFSIPVEQKRFPASITPSVFWGMLQIYWYRNLQVLLTLFEDHLPKELAHLLNLSMDRIRVHFADFCKASRFANPENGYMEYSGKRRKLQPNLGNNDAERKVDKAPYDAFQSWKQYLYMCEDTELMDFDFMFAQFTQGEHSNLYDQQYCMRVHSRAAYLTRYWDHEEESQDQELKLAIDNLLALSFDLPKGFILSLDDVNYQPPPDHPPAGATNPPRLMIEGLQGLWKKEKEHLRIIVEALHEFKLSSANFGRKQATNEFPDSDSNDSDESQVSIVAPVITEEEKGQHLTRMRGAYNTLIFLFNLQDRIRDNIARFIDVADDTLVSDHLAQQPSNVSQKKTAFTERDIARYWLDVAQQYGFLNINNIEPGQEQTWLTFKDGAPNHILQSLPIKDDTVVLNNQIQREVQQQKHLPQRARRHTMEFYTNKQIQYDTPVNDYAHPDDEHLYHWYSEEASLTHVFPRGPGSE
ncbi:hypothetical protein L211DRAFT_867136 [Terfezia boudieri ATCC MYA-4762]|uniref:Uncharacterized protein n=1 Tax=Terfezia boudieri ATCC MYA-4762 TaxID=1051890 RepID=A0A3N4LVP3_9PEZI|nr:hypothetical protein L211DRAFT_867136 [Terfezia boudieri ATCC MYA-4762]